MIRLENALSWAHDFWIQLASPWSIYQILIIGSGYFLSRLLAKKIEAWIEARVRKVTGKPGLMRFLVAMLRNTRWILFFFFLCSAYFIMQRLTWPSHSYFVGIGARLALAWVGISVLSKIIRNRALARAVAFFCWVLVALSMLGQLDTVTGAMDAVAFSVGEVRLSLLKIFNGVILIVALLWIASSMGHYIERKIGTVDDLTPSLKVLAGKIIRIVLIVVALLMAMSSIGIDLTALTIFSGAVGVGIGFGLQKVVSNFISGIIILLDKSIKPGDTISLGNTFGWIRELRARFVSVVTRDGREYLIPNEDLITQQVVNWSFTDKLIRIDVPFGVSYNSDPHEVTRIAITASSKIERISPVRAPVCWMTEFGDSSLNFLLRFWIEDPQNGLTNIRGKVMLALWDAFKENSIDIPFPHRELIFRNSPPAAFNIDPSNQKQSIVND